MANARIFASALLVSAATLINPAQAEITADLSGRLMLDYAFYDEDIAGLDDGGEIRRARLAVKGQLADDWDYKLELDFAGGDTEVKDAYIGFSGLPLGAVTLGNQKVPQSLEELTSSRFITFMERSLPNAFHVGRRLGVQFQHHSDNFGIQAMLFGQEPNDSTGGEGFGARGYYTPLRTDDQLIHLAASSVWEDPEDGDFSQVRYRTRPESHVTDIRLINTGHIDNVERQRIDGLEAAAVFGPVHLQAEWLGADVSREFGPDYDFSGYYLLAGWFITGESRPYRKGKFDRIKPLGDAGAWEVAIRASHLDLNDGAVSGGEEDNLGLAVSWYALPNLRFTGEYIDVDTDLPTGDDNPDVLQFRAQYDF